MAKYYVNDNAQANGDHEVHHQACSWLPEPANRTYLGEYSNCVEAVVKAKTIYWKSNGCKWCSPACHTS